MPFIGVGFTFQSLFYTVKFTAEIHNIKTAT